MKAKTLIDPLAAIGIKEKPAKSGKSAIPTIVINHDGDPVAEYTKVCQDLAALEARKAELGLTLREHGWDHVISHNVAHADEPKVLLKSVRMQDPQPEGAEALGAPDTVMFTAASTFLKFDRAQAEEQLKQWGKDPNAVLEWVVEAEFDTDVFNGPDGKFDPDRYAAFTRAVEAIAKKLRVESPLTCGKVCKVRADFAEKRWSMFTVEQIHRLTEILPNKTSVEVVKSNGSAD